MPPKPKNPINCVLNGDCLKVLPDLPKAKLIFADPPDNLGLKYDGFTDRWDNDACYMVWLSQVTKMALRHCDIFWLSYFYKWDFQLKGVLYKDLQRWEIDIKPYIWWYTFGQHNKHDNGSSFRPMLRFKNKDAMIYPDAIREPSARLREYSDKRANPAGKVPGDVWDGVWQESRVCGTFDEKRKWHLNQHPEVLVERMIKLCCVPGDIVIDMFAGTGTVNRVCKRLGIHCYGIEISENYCKKIREEIDEQEYKIRTEGGW